MSESGRAGPLWLLAGALVVLLGGGLCVRQGTSPEPSVRPGSALVVAVPDSLGEIALPPGQEAVELGAGLRNESSAPLEITKLRTAETRGVPDAAEVVRVALVDPASVAVAGGWFVTFPPVGRRGGTCVPTKVFPARGATLEPGESPLLLLWIRAVAHGRATVPAVNVTYEQNDDVWQQTVRVDGAAVIHVRDDASPLEPTIDEQACASQVRLLPGAVQI